MKAIINNPGLWSNEIPKIILLEDTYASTYDHLGTYASIIESIFTYSGDRELLSRDLFRIEFKIIQKSLLDNLETESIGENISLYVSFVLSIVDKFFYEEYNNISEMTKLLSLSLAKGIKLPNTDIFTYLLYIRKIKDTGVDISFHQDIQKLLDKILSGSYKERGDNILSLSLFLRYAGDSNFDISSVDYNTKVKESFHNYMMQE